MRKILQSSLLLLVVLVCVPAAGQAAGKASYSSSTERGVLVLLNDIRHAHGLSAFVASTALHGAAREHSSDMLKRGYFEHDGPSESFDKRIRRFLKSPLVGENIAWGTGSYGSAEGIVGLWMHSPAHRRIILMPTLRRVGLGVATGSFQGNQGAVMATADFAS
ncbi:MAG: hypothetical protein QOE87_267 [Gaiellales bacterium]|jgi:uncharacterized protein YkwD|nr:hypothetical protein [Gaiellales bacterium]